MRFLLCISVAILVFHSAQAGDTKDKGVLLDILTTWKGKQLQIHSIRCAAKVESFYPKGGFNSHVKGKRESDLPDMDYIFRDQPVSWVIDFDNGRVRKESQLEKLYFALGGRTAAFKNEYSLRFSVKNYNRVFRPKNQNEWAKAPAEAKRWDLLEDTGSHDVLSFNDVPLTWVAGGVTGQIPILERLKNMDDFAKWSFRGQAERNGKRCFVIATPEQKSNTLVREFWVETAAPYLIIYCCAREGDKIFWQHDVTYRKLNENFVPQTIKYTEYNGASSAIRYHQLFDFHEFEINSELKDDVFNHKPEPGMLVRYIGKEGYFVVDKAGQIVPYDEAEKGGLWYLFLIVVIVFLALLAFYWRKRRSRGTPLENKKRPGI
jgi:hypothetical protein